RSYRRRYFFGACVAAIPCPVCELFPHLLLSTLPSFLSALSRTRAVGAPIPAFGILDLPAIPLVDLAGHNRKSSGRRRMAGRQNSGDTVHGAAVKSIMRRVFDFGTGSFDLELSGGGRQQQAPHASGGGRLHRRGSESFDRPRWPVVRTRSKLSEGFRS